MTLVKSLLMSAALLVGATVVANAQVPYPYPYTPAPATPLAWSYDPYTSGLSPCPQRGPGDLGKCGDRMPATYGQPDFAEHTYPRPGYYPWWYHMGYYQPGYPSAVR
jgi:hypothetical protein